MKPVALEAYQWPPSTEVSPRRVGLDPRAIVRFDGNVAAAPPPSARPAALARALAEVNEYERGRYLPLREAIARYHGLEVENVALGAGSDEFIVLLAQMFATGAPSRPCRPTPIRCTATQRSWREQRWWRIRPWPTSSTSVDRTIQPVNLRDPRRLGSDRRGRGVRPVRRGRRARSTRRGHHHPAHLLQGLWLAGARVGYALATPDLIEAISSRQAPLSVSSLSAALALTAIASPSTSRAHSMNAIDSRVSSRRSVLTPLRSYHELLVHPHGRSREARRSVAALRSGDVRAYPGGLRVSVRDQIDNDFLLDALRAVLFDTPDARAVPALRAQHRRDAAQHSFAGAGRGSRATSTPVRVSTITCSNSSPFTRVSTCDSRAWATSRPAITTPSKT